MTKQYKTDMGVVVTAEQITDENHELFGFWRTTDKDNNVGHVPDDLFKATFTEVVDTPAKSAKKGTE